jgi:signal transduction histidine kinase/ActR/RegA family two-component response regulator
MAWLLLLGGLAAGAGLAWLVFEHRRRQHQSGLETEAERLRDQLQRAQAMEAVGILAGSIVHNLNNLLTAILGHCRLAIDDLDPDHPAQRNLEQVMRAGEAAGALTREILDFELRAEQERQPQRLQAIVLETVKLLRDILPQTVEIRTRLDQCCGPVLASSPQLQQLLLSLCSNAYHAMASYRGTISISLEDAQIEQTRDAVPQPLEPGDYVRLSVQDDGRGMDAPTLTRIFEPYFSGREPRRGAGLGLTTVKRILAAHEGAAIPQSQPGQGTRIDIYFPLIAREVRPVSVSVQAADATPQSAPPALRPDQSGGEQTARRAPGHPVRVLLVDDEEMVADMLQMGLERLGYQVTTRAGGPQGLAAFVESPDSYDVVVSDQIMRGLTGMRLAREIHALQPSLPVILVTGFRDSVEDDRAGAAGVVEVLEKPLSHRDVAAAIERALAAGARRTLEERA